MHDNAEPLAAGARAEVAMVANAANASVPWNAERGEPTGTLDWDAAWEVKTVDARGAGLTTDWLVIDLPRVYPELPATLGVFGMESPFTRYVSGVERVNQPELGRVLLRAQVQGWIP